MNPQSPAHVIKKSLLAILSLIVIYTVSFNFIDIPCAQLMHHLFGPIASSDQKTVLSPNSLTDTGLSFILCHASLWIKTIFSPSHWLVLSCIFILISFGLTFAKKSRLGLKNFSLIFLKLGSIGILAFILTGILKVLLARYRPIEFFTHGLYGFHFLSDRWAFDSTPSGHTSMAFAILGGLASQVKKTWLWILIIIICLIIAASRLILNNHYLSDLIFGGYVGLLSVYWVNYLVQNFLKK